MTKLKKIATTLTAGLLLVTATGCAAQFRASDVEATPNSVIRTSYNGWTQETVFEYRGSDRQVEILDNCGKPDFFGQWYCENTDGSVHLDYTLAKGGLLVNVALTVDGVQQSMSCARIENDGRPACIPK